MICRTTLFAVAALFLGGISAASAQVPPKEEAIKFMNPPGSETGDRHRSKAGIVHSAPGTAAPGSRTGEMHRSRTANQNLRKHLLNNPR
jgi:hypothetical protein